MEPRPPIDRDRPRRAPATDPGQRTAATPAATPGDGGHPEPLRGAPADPRRGAARSDAADPMATRPLDAPPAPRFASAPPLGSRTVRAGNADIGRAGFDDDDGYPFAHERAAARGRRRRGVAIALGTLVLLGALAVGAVLWNQSRDGGGNGDGTRTAGVGADDPARATEQAELAAFRLTATVAAAAPTAPPTATTAPPTATPPPPITAPEPTPPPTTAPDAGSGDTAPGAAASGTIGALLPTEDEVPAGLVFSTEGERTEQEVIDALGGTEEAAAQLATWGWRGNEYRNFQVPEGDAPAAGATGFLDVSIHRFGGPDSAAEALAVFSDLVLTGETWQEIEVADLGDQSRALLEETDLGRNVVFYIRSGSLMIRVGGFSADGDPTEDLVDVTETILAK